MPSNTIPEQYKALLGFMLDCSRAYKEGLAKEAEDVGLPWNHATANLEIDIYFVFLLSASMLAHGHNRSVWTEMCFLCESALVGFHEEKLWGDSFSDVIASRIKEYGEIKSRGAERGEGSGFDLGTRLLEHVDASSSDGDIVTIGPRVITLRDAFQRHELQVRAVCLDMQIAGWFRCGLKHILQRANDIRELSGQEIVELAARGQIEADAITAKAFEKMRCDKPGKPRRWWQFWR